MRTSDEWHKNELNWFGAHTRPDTSQRTIGVPLEVQLFLTPTPYVGIGLLGVGNINSAKMIYGAALPCSLVICGKPKA